MQSRSPAKRISMGDRNIGGASTGPSTQSAQSGLADHGLR